MKCCQGSVVFLMDGSQRLTYQKAWLSWAVLLTCDFIIKYNLKIPKKEHWLINYGSWYRFIRKQPLMVFQIARKGWWKKLPWYWSRYSKGLYNVIISKFSRKRGLNFCYIPFMKKHYSIMWVFFFSYPLQPSFPSLTIWFHLWL